MLKEENQLWARFINENKKIFQNIRGITDEFNEGVRNLEK
jgi:hypothetical protein